MLNVLYRVLWLLCCVENITLGNLLSKAMILLCLLKTEKEHCFTDKEECWQSDCERTVMYTDLLYDLKHAATPIMSLFLSLYTSHHDLIQSMSSIVVTKALNSMKWLFIFVFLRQDVMKACSQIEHGPEMMHTWIKSRV